MPKRHLEPDLLAIDILTMLLVIVVLVLPVPFLRGILGLLFILFFPGYVLIAAIYTGKNSPGTAIRLALSLGLSIAVSVFIGLILGISPWGFTLNSILTAMSLFTLATSGLAWYLRKRQIPPKKSTKKAPSFFSQAIQSYRSAGRGYRSLVIILVCVILGGLSSLSYVITRPLPSQAFSEFYILGTGGKAEAYPRELLAGEEGRIIAGIINHEARKTSYRIQVISNEAQLYDLPSITLCPDEKWQQDIGFTLLEAGKNKKVEFRLYKDGTSLYETRYIRVNVTG
jgi:uncharacterized membrane protein